MLTCRVFGTVSMKTKELLVAQSRVIELEMKKTELQTHSISQESIIQHIQNRNLKLSNILNTNKKRTFLALKNKTGLGDCVHVYHY